MKQYLIAVFVSCLFLAISYQAPAGQITSVGAPAINVSVPSGGSLSLNNDGPFTVFANVTEWDVIFNVNLDPVDITLTISDTGGTSEFQIFNKLFLPNEILDDPLVSFDIAIIDPTIPAGLNFDTDDSDIVQAIQLDGVNFNTLAATQITWNNPTFFATPVDLTFAIDTPDISPSGDGNYQFTLRYTPLIPEPNVLAIFMFGIPLILAPKAYRFSNQR